MTDDITYCEDCDHLHPATAKKHPAVWQCLKHPRLNGFGFMSETWADEPYMRCQGINGGKCPSFEEIRVTPNTLKKGEAESRPATEKETI